MQQGGCITGTFSPNCDVCDARHFGFLCSRCKVHHYGASCLPCECEGSEICNATVLGDGSCRTRFGVVGERLMEQRSTFVLWMLVCVVGLVVFSKLQDLDGGWVAGMGGGLQRGMKQWWIKNTSRDQRSK